MSNSKYISIKELHRLAMAKSDGAIPDVSVRQLLPIPVIRSGGLQILFLFSPALALPNKPVKIAPPQHMITLNPVTGEREQLSKVSPKDFGIPHNPDEEVGTFAMPDGMSVNEFVQKRDQLFDLYDQLLPLFASGSSSADSETKEAGKKFKQLFAVVSEAALISYYRTAGKDFFDWVDRIAR